jgi:pimeloyl-ACP methyl ester carboxylesterase
MRVRLRDGLRIFVDFDGSVLRPDGATMRSVPTLVLIHGGPGFDHSSFKVFFPRFTDGCQLLYYDHRGMGRSDTGSARDWNLDTWAQDLGDLLDALGVKRPVLLGQSFGGFVAMRYASRRPDQLAGLVLSSTAARHVPADSLMAFERRGGAEARAVAEAFFANPGHETWTPYREVCFPLYNTTPQDPQIRERQIFTPEVLFHFWRTEHPSIDLRPELDGITCPTLVVAGQEDPITPVARSREIAKGLAPHLVSLAVVPDAGHGVFRDTPEEFKELLSAFLASLGPAPPVPTPLL